MLESGIQLEFHGSDYAGASEIPRGRIYADNSGGFLLDDQGLALRRQIARDGVVVVLLQAGSGEIILKTYGFDLDPQHRLDIMAAIKEQEDEEGLTKGDLTKKAVKRFFRKRMERRPHIDIVEI